MKGVFVKRAFDDGSQGRKCIREEYEEGVEEGIVSGCQERRHSERCEVSKKAILGLHTSRSARYNHNRTTYLCDAKEVFHPGPEFFACNDTVQRFGAVDNSLGMRF